MTPYRFTFQLLFSLLTTVNACFADNGHLISTTKTSEYNVALFAEPWPARVGELQLQFIITDSRGNLVADNSVLSMHTPKRLILETTGVFMFQYALKGIDQTPIAIEVLPKASILRAYWQIWLFLVFGLIFIILREKLAKIHARRYPSL